MMSDRRQELEMKKQRLAELRLQRQQKAAADAAKYDAGQSNGGAATSSATAQQAATGRQTMSQKELDELLLNVGIQPRSVLYSK